MIEKILASKLAEYAPASPLEQERVLSELMQQYALVGLARAGLFRQAAFHGGTFLRIVHGLDRFSEDLDFVLLKPDPDFRWGNIQDRLTHYLAAEGLAFEVVDRSAADAAVKRAFLKTNSIGRLLVLNLPHGRDSRRKIRIKLEVDSRPPVGSVFETSYISFPVMTAITTQDLPSSFASKSHALLCRDYIKGRDWYDFLWYCARKVRPNLELLTSAVQQVGPWEGQGVAVTPEWYVARLGEAIDRIDWAKAADDVRSFLSPAAQQALSLWSADLFRFHAQQLEHALR